MNIRLRTIRRLALGAILTVSIAGCGGKESPRTTEPQVGPGDSSQMANPASVFCIEQGGTLDIVDESGGQVGYCTLPDGTRVEEWEYYRSQNPEMPGDEDTTPDTTG